MLLNEFLDEYIEGYLFGDLENMATIPTAPTGAAAWPMVISVLSGMELLGALLFDQPFNAHKGDTYFSHYWTHFLGAAYPEYQSIPGGDGLIRSLVRHGLAHSFLTAPGIMVTKNRTNHLRFYPAPLNTLSIDSLQFTDDFVGSYKARACPIVCGTPLSLGARTISRESMQDRLVEIGNHYVALATKHLGVAPSTRLVK
jgi:hypothetical protein